MDDSEEIASDYAKNIVKIARRIEFASIYPPNALNEMQAAIIEFDELQNKEQACSLFCNSSNSMIAACISFNALGG